jgi:hypothetical protein
MTIVRDGLVQHEIMLKEAADIFIAKLAKMNAYALKCRYGEKVTPTKVHSAMCYYVTKQALLNMLQCIRYQCSEGDTDSRHRTVWNALGKTIGQLAESIVNEMTKLNELPWAIFDKADLVGKPSITKLHQARG